MFTWVSNATNEAQRSRLRWRYALPMGGLTRKEAAKLVGVSRATITGWVGSGFLHPTGQGRSRLYDAGEVRDVHAAIHAGGVVPRWRANPVRAGKRLRTLREHAHLTQLQLAHQADTTHEEISRLEQGEKSPKGSTVRKLSVALGVTPTQFVDDTPIGLEMLTVKEVAQRLDVTEWRVRDWLKHDILPATKVGERWRVPAIAVAELDRSGRLRGESRRLDPRYWE